ncbi:HesA/MoeB/ThiF family protein [bacterium]|nr:HesA/MoeB/ThiF family protein [bacterium]
MVNESLLRGTDLDRYTRQIIMPLIREEGQLLLKKSSVVIVGAGGLGGPILQYLSAAGIGKIGIVDFDEVQPSNLNRQTLYKPHDHGQNKAILAASWATSFNPLISLDPLPVKLDSTNIRTLLEPYPILIDASDNFATRYLLSDYAFESGKPLFFGAVSGFTGVCTTFIPGETGCLRCIYPKTPSEQYQSLEKSYGIIGFTPGVVGSIMASNVVRYLLQIGNYLKNQLLTIDLNENSFMTISYQPNPNCITPHQPL